MEEREGDRGPDLVPPFEKGGVIRLAGNGEGNLRVTRTGGRARNFVRKTTVRPQAKGKTKVKEKDIERRRG